MELGNVFLRLHCRKSAIKSLLLFISSSWIPIAKRVFYRFNYGILSRGGSRTVATSKMEHFVIIVTGWKPLTIITKSSILDAATVLDPPLLSWDFFLQRNANWTLITLPRQWNFYNFCLLSDLLRTFCYDTDALNQRIHKWPLLCW